MSEPGTSTSTVQSLVDEARRILEAVVQVQQSGQQATLTAVRRAVQSFISLPLSQYVSFLDRYGLLAFRRTDGTVAVTEMGMGAVQGMGLDQLAGFVAEQFPNLPPGVASAPAVAPPAQDVPPEQPPSIAPGADQPAPVPGSQPAMSVPQVPAPAAPAAEAVAPPEPEPAPVPPQQEPAVTRQERFERGDAIGTGGLAIVYAAEQVSLGRRIALKQFSDVFQYFTPDQRRIIETRLVEVIREHSSLAHPHIVRLLDSDFSEEYPVVAMEFCPGGSLRDEMAKHDRMPVGLAVQYFLQISEALRYGHTQGVLHRNLKPENVLLDAQGNTLVSDFGITRIVERDDEHIRQVYVGVGTVAYMAPEQYQDARNASVQGDIYSLGIMFYEMLTGKLPGRRSPMPSAYFEDIPPELDDIFDKMTMDFLDVRYATMEEVLKDMYSSPDVMRVIERRAPVLFTSMAAALAQPEAPAAPADDDVFLSVPTPSAPVQPAVAPAPTPAQDAAPVPQAPAEQVAAPAPAPAPAPAAPAEPNASGGGARLDDIAGDLFGD